MRPSIAYRLEVLGFGRPGVEIDDAIHRVLDELEKRRGRCTKEGCRLTDGHTDPHFPPRELERVRR